MKKVIFFTTAIIFISFSFPSYAETTVSAEVSFIFNSFLFLVCGFLVMFMAAGFAMLESGMVTSKSVSVICAKNIGLFSIAGIMFWMFGYNVAYGIPEGGYIGKFIFAMFFNPSWLAVDDYWSPFDLIFVVCAFVVSSFFTTVALIVLKILTYISRTDSNQYEEFNDSDSDSDGAELSVV